MPLLKTIIFPLRNNKRDYTFPIDNAIGLGVVKSIRVRRTGKTVNQSTLAGSTIFEAANVQLKYKGVEIAENLEFVHIEQYTVATGQGFPINSALDFASCRLNVEDPAAIVADTVLAITFEFEQQKNKI